jgi:MFS family permease
VLRGHWRALLTCAGARLGPDVMYSLYAVFSLTWLTTVLGLPRAVPVALLAIGAAINAVCMVAAGMLSDRFGRRAVYGLGVLLALLWLPAFFPALDTRAWPVMLLAIATGSAIHAFMYGPQAAFIAEQFPAQVRYAGASLAYTFAGIFAGGIAPLAFTALYRAFGRPAPIAIYTAAALLITAVVLIMARGQPTPRSS